MKLFKNNSESRLLHRFVETATFVLLCGIWGFFGKDKLYWEGMHSMFRYSADYFQEIWGRFIDTTPIGFFFVNQFFRQFLIVPWLGALVVVGLSVLNYSIFKRLLSKHGFSAVAAQNITLSLLLALNVSMVFSLFNECFLFLAILPVFYGTIAGYLNIKNTVARLIFGFIMLWILPFFVGNWIMAFGLFMIIYEWKLLKQTAVFMLCLAVLTSIFLPPYIWKYSINYSDMLSSTPISLNKAKNIGIILIMALPLMGVFGAMFFSNIGKFVKNRISYIIFGIVLCASVFTLATSKHIRLFNLYYRIEAKIEHRDWESVLKLCNTYLDLTEHRENKGFYYPYVVDNTKISLSQTGRLLNDFFSYTKYEGFGLLFSQNLTNTDMSHPGMYNFFSAVGLQSEAIRSTFNQITVDGGTPFTVQNLIQSYWIVGDFRPSVLFINRLDQTLFFRKQAGLFRKLLEDTAKLNSDPFYIQNRKLLPQKDFPVSQSNVDFNMLNHWLSNYDNQRAGEYVVAMALSAKQHAIVMPDIDYLLSNFKYRHIPRHIEEALIVQTLFTSEFSNEDPRELLLTREFGGLKIRRETIMRADNFFYNHDLFQNGQISFSDFQKSFGDTYWFHVLFVQVPPPDGGSNISGYAI
jgi:hypothetical protein